MPCLNCGNSKTIQAHLMPRAFIRPVQVGKSHAFVSQSGDFRISQSGIFDRNILCETCDNNIGKLEDYASTILSQARQSSPNEYDFYEVDPFDGNRFIRFCSSLLWKYSATQKEYGRLDLGPYQKILREISFNNACIPDSVDAFIILLKRFPDDKEIIGYRAPLLDRKESINFARFWIGGFLVFVKLDKRRYKNSNFLPCLMRNKMKVTIGIAPATMFEEFNDARKLVFGNQRLSNFLENQESR
jgi:hypothetical protein